MPIPVRNMILHKGFTLIEIMVVLAIMGIAVGAAVVNMEPSAGQTLEREARGMALALEVARDEALFIGRPVGWRISEGKLAFYTRDATDEWVLATTETAGYAPSNGAAIGDFFIDDVKADEDTMAFFLPHGFGSPFRVKLVLAHRSAVVYGDRLGRIKMEMEL